MQRGLLCACSRTGSEGGTRVQHGLLCACSHTGSEGGESSVARAALCLYIVIQGVRGGVECSTGCSVPVVVQGVRGESSAARAALYL